MAKKHSFAKGVATGVLGTAATVAGAGVVIGHSVAGNAGYPAWPAAGPPEPAAALGGTECRAITGGVCLL